MMALAIWLPQNTMPADLAHASPESVGLSSQKLAQLNAALVSDIAGHKLPGAVITVARHGKLVWFHNLGHLQPQDHAVIPKDAIFRIYSMTKPVVSAAAMCLIEQGRLQLHQAIADHLPAFAHSQVLHPSGESSPLVRPITVHDLLRHTAGFTYDFTGRTEVHKRYLAARLFNRGYTNAEFVDILAQLPLLHQPGLSWCYSHATDVLGRVLEVVSQQPLGEFLKAVIFDPLGMQDTGFFVPEAQHYRIAEPYAQDPDRGTAVRLFDVRTAPVQEMAGAGLVSTAMDYARFMQMLVGHGALGNVRILRPENVDLMTTDQLQGLPREGPFLAPEEGFSLGLATRLLQPPLSLRGAAGQCYWAGLAGTSFFVDPAQGLHAQILLQQPGRREHYQKMLWEYVYAALLD
jgi:CubicO group peptidase (beta-lactamase class C family)